MTIPAYVLQDPFIGVAGETKAFNVIAEQIGCQGLKLSLRALERGCAKATAAACP